MTLVRTPEFIGVLIKIGTRYVFHNRNIFHNSAVVDFYVDQTYGLIALKKRWVSVKVTLNFFITYNQIFCPVCSIQNDILHIAGFAIELDIAAEFCRCIERGITESLDKLGKRIDDSQREFGNLQGTRKRALEKPLEDIARLREGE